MNDEFKFMYKEMKFLCKELEELKIREAELNARDARDEKIGIIVYSYNFNTLGNCVYTYNPMYENFVSKICSSYESNDEKNNTEKLIGSKIISKSELDTLKWILNGISNNAVIINDLNELFKSIDPNSDEVELFNYNDLLADCDDSDNDDDKNMLTMIGLNEKKLSEFRIK
jgi:hypothetical protein